MIPNQIIYQDTQSFDINIEKIYADFIKYIDRVRSTANCNNIINAKQLLQSTSSLQDAKSKLMNLCDISDSVQESRCHAFFRIIGFPCCDFSKTKIFNPGFDPGVIDSNRVVNMEYKLNVIKNPIPKFRELSITRELYPSTTAAIFANPNSIDASVLALSSGRNIRKFISPLINLQFDDMNVINQQYSNKMNFTNYIGALPKSLLDYVNVNNTKPEKLKNFNFAHIIKPFLVDPIIDLTVNDSTKLIAVPFALAKNKLQVKNDVYISRPILEQVIRERFGITDQNNLVGASDASIIEYVKSIESITDVNILKNINSIYTVDEQNQLIKFLNIIRAMITKLIDAQNDIIAAQNKYYWVPKPSIVGPEGGCSVQGVFVSAKIPSQFSTADDTAIIYATIQNMFAEANTTAATTSEDVDLGDYALPNTFGIPNVGGKSTPNALGNDILRNLNNLVAAREDLLRKANNALRIIEIITGEFSGLGLCDILAVLGALYLMPKESLIGFLDEDSISRMISSGIYTDEILDRISNPDFYSSTFSLITASNDFISVVKDLYNLMDKIYEDQLENKNKRQ
jgi:hypothetical protein